VVQTREPGGTQAPRRSARCCSASRARAGARAEALLFAAARADHVEGLIRPALARGLGGLRPFYRFHPRLSGRRRRAFG
jgi:dTMP kinase